jgi:hypothetical protein
MDKKKRQLVTGAHSFETLVSSSGLEIKDELDGEEERAEGPGNQEGCKSRVNLNVE